MGFLFIDNCVVPFCCLFIEQWRRSDGDIYRFMDAQISLYVLSSLLISWFISGNVQSVFSKNKRHSQGHQLCEHTHID